MNDSVVTRAATALGLAVLCAISVLRVTRPPSPVPATAPDTVFSAERAMRHVEAIAVRPHPMGTADHDRVRDYIMTTSARRADSSRVPASSTRPSTIARPGMPIAVQRSKR